MPPRLFVVIAKQSSPAGTQLFSLFVASISTSSPSALPARPVTKYRFPPGTFGTFVLLTPAKPCDNYVSMSMETLTRAWEVLQDAYQAQMEGDYDRAVELYQSSLELHPAPEAHTSFRWTYHFQ